MISSLGDAGLNTFMICNNMQGANHKSMMLAQKEPATYDKINIFN